MANKQITPIAIWPGLEDGVPKPIMPYSPAIRVGDWVFIAGQLASDFKTGVPKELEPNPGSDITGLELQSDFIFRNMAQTVQAAGCNMSTDTVKIWEWFVSNKPDAKDILHGNYAHDVDVNNYETSFSQTFDNKFPSRSSIGIKELMWLGTKIELEVMCLTTEDKAIYHNIGSKDEKPGALRKGDWVFISNQSPENHKGEIPESLEAQIDVVMSKVAELLERSGSSLENAVKAEVFISNPNDFHAMDQVWKKWFPANPPARFVLPRSGMQMGDSRVEVSMMSLINDSSLSKKIIETSEAPEPLGHEPQAVQVDYLLFYSTQMAFDSSGKIAEGMTRNNAAPWYGRPAQAQMRYMMSNINTIAEAAGSSVENIVRRACFHNDLQWFAESIEEWARYFPNDKPASTTIGLNDALVIEGSNTLLDLIAYVPK